MSTFPEHDLHIGKPLRGSESSTVERQKARRTVAAASTGVSDRALLLEMLGLVPDGLELVVAVP